MNTLRISRPALRRRQRGLTLVEFMISITIGLLMVAAIAALIASQSGNRAEVDRAGRMIENGRYAIRALADDIQLAGYWGELSGVPTTATLAALPDPCSLALADIEAASQLHIQGYDAPASGSVPSCVTEQQPGTDILVVRHADPDTSSLETAPAPPAPPVPDLSKLTEGQAYIQTGLNVAGTAFDSVMGFGAADTTTNATQFSLKKKDKTTTATVRKVVVRIYYIAKCSVQASGSCAAGDGGNPIPTLKMVELAADAGAAGWSDPVTIAEGIETMQIDYGLDTDADGAPDGADVDGSLLTKVNMGDVMTLRLHLVARSLEKSPGYTDDKTYDMGTSPAFGPTGDGYKRHAFVQSVRLVNPSGRRQP